MATWPDSLPAPQLPGYVLETQDATRRSDMESGAARVRRVSTSVPDKVTLKWQFDESQMATFRDFWDVDWNFGAAWVVMPIKEGRSPGLVNLACRPVPAVFKSVPISATHWQVEISAEVRRA